MNVNRVVSFLFCWWNRIVMSVGKEIIDDDEAEKKSSDDIV